MTTTAPLDKTLPLGKTGLSHSVIFWIGFCVVIAVLAAAPLMLPEFWRRFLTEVLIWGLLAMSSDLVALEPSPHQRLSILLNLRASLSMDRHFLLTAWLLSAV